MIRILLAPVAFAAVLLAGCGGDSASGNSSAPAGAAVAAPNGDWTQTVEATPEGGFRMGNPAAPVKLVEYGSVGCHVCAEFSEQGSAPLQERFVKSGRVSWEFRPILLLPPDPGVSMLLRCQGPGPFFQSLDQLYADQEQWMAQLQAAAPALQARFASMTPLQRSAAVAGMAGHDQFFRVRGMPQSKIDSCLSDPAGLQAMVDLTKRSQEEGVTGTPTFFINGAITEAHGWPALEPLLRQAGG
ncbi:MAG TPA: thioredoxin domain-containing protein [Allosphingosinicella sp.]